MAAGGDRELGAWVLGAVAVGLVIWAIVDFIDPGDRQPVRPVHAAAAAEQRVPVDLLEPTELYHLLPDATRDVGRVVQVDGTVLGRSGREGFWIRDIRDHIVFVGGDEADHGPEPGPGEALRVTGLVALFPLPEQAERFAEIEGRVPEAGLVIRDIKVIAVEGGIRAAVP